jgi:hypothetical protein
VVSNPKEIAMLSKNSLRAELSGSTICTAAGQVAIGHTPILVLCRELIAAGYDPATPLKVYRDGTLALRVRSIGAGAKLTVDEHNGTRFAKWKPWRRSAGSPRIARGRAEARL